MSQRSQCTLQSAGADRDTECRGDTGLSGRESGHEAHSRNHQSRLARSRRRFTASEKLEGWVPELATPEELHAALEQAFDYRGDVSHHPQRRQQDRRLHLRPPPGNIARRQLRAHPAQRWQRRSWQSPTPILPPWLLPGAIWPPGKAGKTGSSSTGKRRPRAREIFRFSRRSWSKKLSAISFQPSAYVSCLKLNG